MNEVIQFLRTWSRKLLLTLRSYATGTFQLASRGDLCDISQPSESRIIERVYSIPRGWFATSLPHIKLDLWRMCAFPNIVCMIDCTHIKIPCPGGKNAKLFRNRKGFFSNNVQAVSGPNIEFQSIVVRWPGPEAFATPEYYFHPLQKSWIR